MSEITGVRKELEDVAREQLGNAYRYGVAEMATSGSAPLGYPEEAAAVAAILAAADTGEVTPTTGELVAFGKATEEAQQALVAALEHAEAERKRADAAEAKAAEYENAISWNTSCVACARVLDSCAAETERADKLQAELNALADSMGEAIRVAAEEAEAEVTRLRTLLAEQGCDGEAREYLEPREAARILGVGVTAVGAWEAQGKLTAVRRGRYRRYLAASVEALRRERTDVKTAQNGKGRDV